MSDTVRWVSDRLHDMLDISDRNIAEFLIGLCRKSSSPEIFLEKIRETETIDINDGVRVFAGTIIIAMIMNSKRKSYNKLFLTIKDRFSLWTTIHLLSHFPSIGSDDPPSPP